MPIVSCRSVGYRSAAEAAVEERVAFFSGAARAGSLPVVVCSRVRGSVYGFARSAKSERGRCEDTAACVRAWRRAGKRASL